MRASRRTSGSARLWLPLLLLLVLVPALSACGEAPAAADAQQAPVPVRTVAVGASEAGAVLRATGTVRGRRETSLGFTTAGRIALIGVDEGDRVAAGQVIARLAPDQVDAAYEAARAEAVRAQQDLARHRTLLASGWTTRARVEALEATARAATARVSAAGFDRSAATIVSPVEGIVLRRHVERNQIVAAGTPIVTMAEGPAGFVLRVPLADRDLAMVRPGSVATVSIPALGGEPLSGRVIEIAGRGDDRTGTFSAEIALPMTAGLRSGMIGTVKLRTGAGAANANAAIAITPMALFGARGGEGFVYVVENGRVRARLVQVGEVTDTAVLVTDGLKPGERIVTSGTRTLTEGMAVREGAR